VVVVVVVVCDGVVEPPEFVFFVEPPELFFFGGCADLTGMLALSP
jgi:hypothetical protein